MTFGNLIDLGGEEIVSLSQAGPFLPSRALRVEGMLRHTYVVAVAMAKKSESLDDTRDVWSAMKQVCRKALLAAGQLGESGRKDAAGSLADIALDYEAACEKRLNHLLEEISCQNQEMPPGLFPSLK